MKNNKRQLALMSIMSELFPTVKVQNSHVRTYVKLADNAQSYSIPFKKDTAGVAEALISDSDILVAPNVQIALAKVIGGKISNAQLYTYPDEVVFAQAGSSADDLRSIYNTGLIRYEQGTTIVQDGVALFDAYQVPLTSVATGRPSADYSTDGIVELYPPLAIVGNSLPVAKLSFSAEAGATYAGSAAATGVNYIVLIHRGVLLKGVSKTDYERVMTSANAKAKFARLREANYLG